MKGSDKFWIAFAFTGYGWLTWYIYPIPETTEIDTFAEGIWAFSTSLLFWGLVVIAFNKLIGLIDYLCEYGSKFNKWLDKNL